METQRHSPNDRSRVTSFAIESGSSRCLVFPVSREISSESRHSSRAKANDRRTIGEGGGSRGAAEVSANPPAGCKLAEGSKPPALWNYSTGTLPRGRTCPRQFQTYFNIHISSAPSSARAAAPPNRRLRIPFDARNPRSERTSLCTALFLDVRTRKHKGGLGFT